MSSGWTAKPAGGDLLFPGGLAYHFVLKLPTQANDFLHQEIGIVSAAAVVGDGNPQDIAPGQGRVGGYGRAALMQTD